MICLYLESIMDFRYKLCIMDTKHKYLVLLGINIVLKIDCRQSISLWETLGTNASAQKYFAYWKFNASRFLN